MALLLQLDPSRTQEYKWRELEEQRQAQKLQRQLQQEQAYLLSLQHNQNLDAGKTAQQQGSKPPENPEQERVKLPQGPEQKPNADVAKTRPGQSRSLEKTAEAKLAERRGSGAAATADSERIREVTPPPAARRRLTDCRRMLPFCLCVLTGSAAGVHCGDGSLLLLLLVWDVWTLCRRRE